MAYMNQAVDVIQWKLIKRSDNYEISPIDKHFPSSNYRMQLIYMKLE